MHRRSAIWHLRRKCQAIATKILGYGTMTKIYYYIFLKERCNLKYPKNLNEKICWLKVNKYEGDKLVIQCADKFLVREYIRKQIDKKYLVPLLNVWNNVEEINFDELPDKFILKCNHGCGYNILVDNKNKLNISEAKRKLNKWMKEDFSLYNAEPQYCHIPRKIICEKHLGGGTSW